MSVIVDDRVGSVEFADGLRTHGLEVSVERLDFADFALTGSGPNGTTIGIGIERKTVSDLCDSVRTGRLSGHQLKERLLETYHRVVLLVEGMWRPSPEGVLEELVRGVWQPVRGRFMYRELSAYLTTLQEVCGVVVQRTQSKLETVFAVVTWHRWYEKSFDAHDAHKMLHYSRPAGSLIKSAVMQDPPILKLMAAQLPGVGDEALKSIDSQNGFRSVYDMVTADEWQWMEIDHIGAEKAAKYYRILRNLSMEDYLAEREILKAERRARLAEARRTRRAAEKAVGSTGTITS